MSACVESWLWVKRLNAYSLKVWYHALRPFSYPASIVPVMVGSVIAWQIGPVDLFLFVITLIGSVAAQAGTNLANEYLDFVQGVDREDSLGPAGVIIKKELSPRQVFRAAATAFSVACAIGLYLTWRVGWFILMLTVVSALAAWFYTAKPLAFGYRGLGEPEVFIFMGPITVLGSYYVQTKTATLTPLLVSFPIGFLVMAILHANNLRDVAQDDQRNRVTWAVLARRWLGAKTGRAMSNLLYYAMIAAPYFIIMLLASLGITPLLTLLTIITAPEAIQIIRFVHSGVEGRPLGYAVRSTARLHMLFGTTLTLGYVLSNLLR